MKNPWMISFLLPMLLLACNSKPPEDDSAPAEKAARIEGTFDYDLHFLQQHLKDLIILKSPDGQARVVVSPKYQGRVLTSTAHGMPGKSYGWINYNLIASGKISAHMNAFGGEDRFWLGPEGGQYSVFFPPDVAFTFENWQTPPVIDSEPFVEVSHDEQQAVFTRKTKLTNYSGTAFNLKIDRVVKLLDAPAMASALGVQVDTAVQWVGFASENTITNTGDQAWKKESGLLSVWILGMFRHSPTTTIVLPYQEDADAKTPVVHDAYFGKVPEDRLVIKDGHIFFKGDGVYRSKIGVPPQRAKPVLGSYDSENQVLTLVSFSLPEGKTAYVNSMWEIQEEPYGGDAVNSYNDGPLEAGDQLGPFYELESSSPAAMLQPGEKLTHIHRTFHFTGSPEKLEEIARQVLGVGLEDIQSVF